MEQFRRFWNQSKALTAVCVVMLPAFVLSVEGIFLDPRIITGVPAWLKPAKFAISIAIYAGTLAGIFQFITVQRRFVQRLGAITAAALAVEIVIIDLQAARGTTSHFNNSTPLDGALFGVMGLGF
jgi:fucose 4-O-acetylase-like acetyltransferase